jgi:hypothetical protein
MYTKEFFHQHFSLCCTSQALDYQKAFDKMIQIFADTDPLHLDYKKGWHKLYQQLALSLLHQLYGATKPGVIAVLIQNSLGTNQQVSPWKLRIISLKIWSLRDLYIWPPEAY